MVSFAALNEPPGDVFVVTRRVSRASGQPGSDHEAMYDAAMILQ